MYHRALYGIIYKIVRQDEIAEEVLQDVFIKIWNKIESYDSEKGKLFTWMINLARNSAIDKLRSKEIKQVSKTDTVDEYVTNTMSDPATHIKVDDIGVDVLLNALDDAHKQVFNLVYFEGYTHSEVAEEFDIPLGTVKTRIRSGLLKLRKILAEK